MTKLSDKLTRIRNTGARGTPILMHRALRHVPLTVVSMLSIILLPVLFDALLWIKLDLIMSAWMSIFDFWAQQLSLSDQLSFTDVQIFGRTFSMIYPSLPIEAISDYTAWLNVFICVIIYAISMLLPQRILPLVTLLRAALLIQISASLYCFFSDHTFPYDTAGYLSGMLSLGAYLLFIISPLLAFIYYIFNFSLLKKILVTAGIIGYFIVLIPFLYTMHALIISQWGLLFMPTLYLLFGPLLVTLMFVSFYSLAMTRSKQ